MKTVCGLDVHKDSVFVCILNESGVLFQEKFGVLTSELENMVAVLHSYALFPSKTGKPLFHQTIAWKEK